jgi:hypothetical protein
VTEKEIIEQTYETTIERLCAQLFNALLLPNNGTEYQDAERRFQAGVRRAREIRDRAKELLP